MQQARMHPNSSYRPMTGRQLGMLVALASWAMLFGSFLLATLMFRVRMPNWPPVGVDALPWLVPSVATFVVLGASLSLWKAQQFLEQGRFLEMRRCWLGAVVLSGIFMALQAQLWIHVWHSGLTAHSNIYGSVFYALTGLHVLHVVGASSALLYFSRRMPDLAHAEARGPQLQLLVWFWHFLTAAWLLIFGLVWVL